MRYGYIFGVREPVGDLPFYRLRFSGFRGTQSDDAVHPRVRVTLVDFPLEVSLSIETTQLEPKTHADRLHAITLSWSDMLDFNQLSDSDVESFFEGIRLAILDDIDTTIETPFVAKEDIKGNCNINHKCFFNAISETQRLFEKFASGGKEYIRETISFLVNDHKLRGEFMFARGGKRAAAAIKLPKRYDLPVVDEPTWFKRAKRKRSACYVHAVVPYTERVEDRIRH